MRTQVLILGGGVLTPVLQKVLRQENFDAIVISKCNSNFDKVFVGNSSVNYVPILAVENSYLTERLNTGQFSNGSVKTENFYDDSTPQDSNFEIVKGSYADFIMKSTNNLNYVASSEKLYGKVVYTDPMPEIKAKVERHYINQSRINYGKRLGFKDGLNPYSHFNDESNTIFYDDLQQVVINMEGKFVLVNGQKIFYDVLINTLPAPTFLKLASVEHLLTFYATSTAFVIMTSNEPLIENRLVYDCNRTSNIYRLFTPNKNAIVAQMSQLRSVDISAALKRAKEILDIRTDLSFVEEKTLRNCYPTKISNKEEFNLLRITMQAKDVLMFGRYAQWECLDLHELNWQKLIYDQLQHFGSSVVFKRRHEQNLLNYL